MQLQNAPMTSFLGNRSDSRARNCSTGACDRGSTVLLGGPGDLGRAAPRGRAVGLGRFKELEIDAGTAEQLLKNPPATIDRRLKVDRVNWTPFLADLGRVERSGTGGPARKSPKPTTRPQPVPTSAGRRRHLPPGREGPAEAGKQAAEPGLPVEHSP